jgi:hypothetical protein
MVSTAPEPVQARSVFRWFERRWVLLGAFLVLQAVFAAELMVFSRSIGEGLVSVAAFLLPTLAGFAAGVFLGRRSTKG